ncbi:MAG: type IV secretory system conjugative DNA transfer family protein [Acidimicrobiales bacterium]
MAAGKKQLLARAPVLRPTLRDPVVGDLGLNLGVCRRVGVYFSVEDSMIIVGPPRSGKGLFLAINMILDAPGPVITTSTRPDNLAATLAARSARGRVGVVDLEQLANGVPSTLRWSPIHGCEFPQTAINRAAALCVGAADGIDGGSFWLQQAIAVVRCLLRAAALDHRTMADLARWSVSPNAALDAVAILTESPGEVPNWAWELDAIIAKDPRQRDGVWSLVANVFAPLANPDVIRQLSPAPGEEFIADDFLREDGTLYLLATSSGASATANFIGALIEDVVAAARRLAAASPGARLTRPLTLVLDELASFPIESVKSLMNDGGGSGIATIGIVQSLSQMRDRWGHDGAAALWNSATYKIVLGGSSSVDELRDLVALSGDRESDSSTRRPILDLSMIRTLKEGQALLLLRRARPMVLALRSWTDRKDASRLRQGKQKVEEMLQQGAITKRADRD